MITESAQDERESGTDAARGAWLAPSAEAALAPPPEAAEAVAAAARRHAPAPGSFVVLPDADLARTSPAVALLRRQVSAAAGSVMAGLMPRCLARTLWSCLLTWQARKVALLCSQRPEPSLIVTVLLPVPHKVRWRCSGKHLSSSAAARNARCKGIASAASFCC